MPPRHKKSALNANPLWYKDAVIYQVHVKSFAIRTAMVSAIFPD